MPIGHFNEALLRRTFALCGLATFAGMTLQFNIQPVAETGQKPLHQRFGFRSLPSLQQLSNRAACTAAQTDQTSPHIAPTHPAEPAEAHRSCRYRDTS